MLQSRSAGAMGAEFPYKLRTMFYIEVAKDGTVTHGAGEAAYRRTMSGESRLFAVWPGQWSSDLAPRGSAMRNDQSRENRRHMTGITHGMTVRRDHAP